MPAGRRRCIDHKAWLGGLALALGLAATPALAATVKLGVVLPYSGGGAELGKQIQQGMDLYLQLEGNAKLGEHQIEMIKRDAKGPGGDVAKTAVQELIVREKIDLLTGFVYSPNIIASAPLIEQAKVPTLILNAATAWIPSLSPHLARVSMTMWQTGHPMGEYAAEDARLPDRGGRLHRLPARQGRARRVRDRLRGRGRRGGRRDPDGRAGGGAGLHAVHAAGQGHRHPTASTSSCRPATTPRRCSRPTPTSA